MIRSPATLSAAAASNLADARAISTSCTDWTTDAALARADAAAARQIETLKTLRVQIRGVQATERKRARDEATDRAEAMRRNALIREQRKTA